MKVGGGEKWQPLMLKVDESFTRAVCEVWEGCRQHFSSDSHEDAITNQLVLLLRRRRRHPPPYRVQLQPTEVAADANGKAIITGRHDIHLIFDLNDDDASLIYECKRLNVVKAGKKSTLATEYVSDGMMRFVTGQYSPRVHRSGMLGYVMDGAVDDAMRKVRQAIETRAADLAVKDALTAISPSPPGKRFASNHRRPCCASPFHIQHLLLPL